MPLLCCSYSYHINSRGITESSQSQQIILFNYLVDPSIFPCYPNPLHHPRVHLSLLFDKLVLPREEGYAVPGPTHYQPRVA
nr:MAG TPA: hypothetical protein [Caudoviricetes sp.]